MKIPPSLTPAIQEITPHLYRITLPQPFYEENAVYLLLDKKNLLIDSGYFSSILYLSQALRQLGLSFRKIHYLLLTHAHIDHFSGAFFIYKYNPDIQILAHREIPLRIKSYLRYIQKWQKDSIRLLKTAFPQGEIRTKKIRQIKQIFQEYFSQFQEPLPPRIPHPSLPIHYRLQEGDIISTGRYTLKILHTPGHSLFHITPIEEREKWLFSGDMLLKNLPAIYDKLDGNLEEYLKSLEKLSLYQDFRFFPAHGKEIRQPIEAIEKSRRLISILEKGILKRLKKGKSSLLLLYESALGGHTNSLSLSVGLAMMEAIVEKLMREYKVYAKIYPDGYKEFVLRT